MTLPLIDTHYARTLRETADYPPLDGDLTIETLVIGGGLAGCATALDLAERGHRVALIEAKAIGFGASGRNGGFAGAGFPRGYAKLAARIGLDRARQMQRLAVRGQDLVRERIAAYDIDAGPLQAGQLTCNLAGLEDDLQASRDDMAKNFDVALDYWPKARLREALLTERYADALFNPNSFTVQPLDLTRGLARAAVSRGARIFEATPALDIAAAASGETVRTPRGRIKAAQVVLACGGYIEGLDPTVSAGTIPVATFVMATEPLGDRLARAIRVPYAISDNQIGVNYYRALPDSRILWGGRLLTWQPGPARLAALLKRDMVSFYPALADAKVEVAWGGLMPFTRHRMPVIGRIRPTLWYATGFGGLGVTMTSIVGQLIAKAIAENDEDWRLFEAFGLPYAGGKLGRIPAQLVYWHAKLKARFGIRASY